MIKVITLTVGLTLLTLAISKPARACDLIGPIVVTENGDHIVTYCFDAPTPEPPEGRVGSGEKTFTDHLMEWCQANGEHFVRGTGYACSNRQYRQYRDNYVKNGGVIR